MPIPLPQVLSLGDVLVNEVYYDDTRPGNDSAYEWFELYNKGPASITLDGFNIGDNTSRDTIPQVTIAAGGFAVVAANSEGFGENYPSFTGTVVFIADGRIGDGLADSGDRLVLTYGEDLIADALSYGNDITFFSDPPSASPGHSIERFPLGQDTDWGSDFVEVLPSPGEAPRLPNLVVVDIASYPEGSECVESTGVQVTVGNQGEGDADGFYTALSGGWTACLPWHLDGLAAAAMESFSCPAELPWTAVYTAVVDSEGDVLESNEGDNVKVVTIDAVPTCTPIMTPTFTPIPIPTALLISEILYDGTTPKTEGDEFVELCNHGSTAVRLDGYKLGDAETAGGGEGMYRFPDGATISPGACLVVAKNAAQFQARFGFTPDFEMRIGGSGYEDTPQVPDMIRETTWASGQWALANKGDEVLLLAPDGQVIDAVAYKDGDFATLGLRGAASAPQPRSLQRIGAQDSDDMSADFVATDPNPGLPTLWPTPPDPPPPGALLPSGMRAYFGNLHAQTNCSDGAGPPSYAYAVARANGLHFLGLSDQADQLSAAEWEVLGRAAEMATQEGAFVGLRGFEWTHPEAGHLNVFSTEDFISHQDPQGSTLSDFYTWLASRPGAIAQFNHPGGYEGDFDSFAYHAPADGLVLLQEVGNGTGSNYQIFEAQYLQSLQAGWHVGPANNADTHTADWGADTTHRTSVLAPNLTKADLLSAMRAGRVFATEDANLALALRADEAWMGSIVPPTANLTLYVEFADPDGEAMTLTLYDRSAAVGFTRIAPGMSTGTWPVAVSGAAGHFYFVKAVQADGDMAYTSPIWIAGQLAPEALALNEFLPAPRNVDWDGDGMASYEDEWVELYNPGSKVVGLAGWRLDDMAEGGSAPYVIPLGVSIPSKGFLVLYRRQTGLALNNDGDWVRLLRPDGSVADAFRYTYDIGYDRSWSRTEDGGGTWTDSDSPTPGGPNRFSSPAPTPTPTPQRRWRSIAEARRLAAKIPVIVVGWVTVPPAVLGDEVLCIQDLTGGMMVYLKGGGFSPLAEGDWVEILGQTRDYHGEREIKADGPGYVWLLNGGRKVLSPVLIETGQIDEEHEGLLVQVTGRAVGYGRKSLYLDDGSGQARVYFRAAGLKRPWVEEGDTFTVVGVVSQYAEEKPYQGGYRLLPRYESDVSRPP